MQVITRVEGGAARILDTLVKRKYYCTKSEAIRAGILELGQKWRIHPDYEEALVAAKIDKMRSEIKSGKKRLIPLSEFMKEAGIKT